MIKKILLISLLFSGYAILADPLRDALDSSDRKFENLSRDAYRNPYETISFFKIEPNMKVIELSPGGGWYLSLIHI